MTIITLERFAYIKKLNQEQSKVLLNQGSLNFIINVSKLTKLMEKSSEENFKNFYLDSVFLETLTTIR